MAALPGALAARGRVLSWEDDEDEDDEAVEERALKESR
jgi:hypothetical protein